jgi:hypothetical protein
MQNGETTCIETRLSLKHIIPVAAPDGKITFLPDPYEIVSYCKDSFTRKMGTWRINLSIELQKAKGHSLWYITVHDESNGAPIVILSARDLVVDEVLFDLTPLQRLLRTKMQPVSAWDRIMEDD